MIEKLEALKIKLASNANYVHSETHEDGCNFYNVLMSTNYLSEIEVSDRDEDNFYRVSLWLKLDEITINNSFYSKQWEYFDSYIALLNADYNNLNGANMNIEYEEIIDKETFKVNYEFYDNKLELKVSFISFKNKSEDICDLICKLVEDANNLQDRLVIGFKDYIHDSNRCPFADDNFVIECDGCIKSGIIAVLDGRIPDLCYFDCAISPDMVFKSHEETAFGTECITGSKNSCELMAKLIAKSLEKETELSIRSALKAALVVCEANYRVCFCENGYYDDNYEEIYLPIWDLMIKLLNHKLNTCCKKEDIDKFTLIYNKVKKYVKED